MINRILNLTLSKYPSLQQSQKIYPRFEFHILASVRKKYQVDESLFTISGNVIFPNYHAVRLLAQKMNAQRDLQKRPKQTICTGQLNAMGLIDEIYHYVLRLYEETVNPKVFSRAEKNLHQSIESDKVKKTLQQFVKFFPPLDVFLGKNTLETYLNSSTGDKPHTEVTLEELILLYFANFNTANTNFKELFDDKDLKERTSYSQSIVELEKFFQTEKRFGPQNQFIFDLLRAPIIASPDSLKGQLDFIKKHWGLILSDKFLKKILGADDLIKEDVKLIFHGAPTTPPVPTYSIENMKGVGLLDFECFTSDLDWMPNVVLLAKNIYVWLDQLSKKYQRPITKLNEIPDEELDQLARWNLTALWLIGIWERSSASQKIKQWTGNPEAVSSAYSVYDYEIAGDLGGEEAFQNLRRRAWQRGIRLAGDMVPNHMGIFSKWVSERPDYFIQSNYPPFPNYTFSGGNLSEYHGVELRIEDGYWNRSDAAVAFQRVDKQNGNVRYIYHGNDGTHMPWNDTAQLDFLKAEVREAVIQTIFHVARKFSIIRFDAAMTLTKRHFQRLWYPQPGSGGDIPSRADYALATEEFNKLFPNEFWREVVDRINQEMPNTLLLAEAFWLLEGYFVRTLGMHRVYNSAFMHMLMKEENSKYRELIRNTMHYNPEILKRYVNFMSNPDEQTAIDQFGKDDKYLGVALMMVTLPGLPMFAHGQIEGYTEKYGMEYKRAYYNEAPDRHLIWRHEQEIFPLLGKRQLFSQVTDFELYDFINDNGNINENVFVYSNKTGNERALICYHNKYEETSGRIKSTVGRNVGSTESPNIVYKNLGNALELPNADDIFFIYKDYKTNLQYIRSGKDLHERGLYLEFKAFQYYIFLDFIEVHDTNEEYARLASHLHRSGVPDIFQELLLVRAFPAHIKLFDLINTKTTDIFLKRCIEVDKQAAQTNVDLDPVVIGFRNFARQIHSILHDQCEEAKLVETFKNKLHSIWQILSNNEHIIKEVGLLSEIAEHYNCIFIYSWAVIDSLDWKDKINIFEKLRLDKAFNDIFESFNFAKESVTESVNLLKLLVSDNIFLLTQPKESEDYFNRLDVQDFIELNEHENILYFNKERFEKLIHWALITAAIRLQSIEVEKQPLLLFKQMNLTSTIILELCEEVGYRFEEFKTKLNKLLLKQRGR